MVLLPAIIITHTACSSFVKLKQIKTKGRHQFEKHLGSENGCKMSPGEAIREKCLSDVISVIPAWRPGDIFYILLDDGADEGKKKQNT